MLENISNIEKESAELIAQATDLKNIDALKIKYLGKNGEITALLRTLRDIPADDRPNAGSRINQLKNKIENLIKKKQAELLSIITDNKIRSESLDVTLPGWGPKKGSLHPLTIVMDDAIKIFASLGYTIAQGPEIETEYNNFDALNIPQNHPSRDMWSTFYVCPGYVLRTHTSPVQIRVMKKQKPPIRVIMPGRVYRSDAMDLAHSPIFHQIEGLAVDTGITFGDLKGTLSSFVKQIFGEKIKVRFRPSFFPFTEPSTEIDVQCFVCEGRGCRLCKNTGWLEILGAGLVDPAVFKSVNVDPDKYSGFAFGMGIERIAMLKYGIDDIRIFYENDKRFLEQF